MNDSDKTNGSQGYMQTATRRDGQLCRRDANGVTSVRFLTAVVKCEITTHTLARTHARTHAHTRTRTHTHTHTRTHAHTNTHTNTHTHAHTHLSHPERERERERVVVLDPQESPGEIKRREAELGSES